MVSLFRLFLLRPVIVLSFLAGCSQGGGEPSSVAAENDTPSLAHRPLLTLAFRQPIGIVITNRYRQPLLDYLTEHTSYRFRAVFSRESERTVGMLEQRMAEISHLGVVSYLEAHRQFGAVPLVRPLNRDREAVSRSVFLTRKDSPVRGLTDLEERSLALGAFHSTLSNLIPRHELIRAGVRLETLKDVVHLANDEEVAATVAAGRFDVGAVEDVVGERYVEKGLRVLHTSDPVPSAPLVMRDDLPRHVSEALREALLKLDFKESDSREDWDEEFRYGFAPAKDSDYQPVREIIETSLTQCASSCHGELGIE